MADIVFFAFDISEASQIRRIESVRSVGYNAASYSFRRGNMNSDYTPPWPDVPLGLAPNESYVKRVLLLFPAMARVLRNASLARGSKLWIARNIDLLLLAHAARLLMFRRDVRIAYECLDIHSLFTRKDAVGSVMRWVERRLLARSDLLIVSSPGFVREYFEKVQGYQGRVALIENKLWLGNSVLPRPASPPRAKAEGPFVIGSVGSIRCRKSLKILAETAERMGDKVQIAFHGNVHRHAVPDFDEVVAAHTNMSYHGAYRYPDDLGAIYGSCDLVWSQDLWQSGANSDWLLPNRIYEASWFGCPSIAVKTTETGRRVADKGLGLAIEDTSAEALCKRIDDLTRAEITEISRYVLSHPDKEFRLYPEDIEALLEPLVPPAGGTTQVVEPHPRPVD
ncbi:glycosyl transferase [Pseudoruegeria sp. HB172150]|uniref:glycosyl transferase n=1 Tax=Pseudoruegeria sp. HB172150 TaxID=2721164 RepID=UPI0015541BB9|nr:glycosyl transferase [Pseudoruegeria sp. HB172150]